MLRYVAFIFILIGCQRPSSENAFAESSDELSYATKFRIEVNEGDKELIVTEPWPKAATPVRYSSNKRMSRIVCTSTTHLPFFELLGAEHLIVGFPNLKLVSSEAIQKRAEEGQITDLGPDGNMNLELLIGLNPDAVIAFDMGGESGSLNKISEMGIPVIYNSDFLESNPLGRAEWIKFFGVLLGKEKEADSVFASIEEEYLRLQDLTQAVERRPTVLSGVVYGDTWFLPGGRNWSADFYRSAGGDYLYEQDSTTGWLELSFEAVYEKCHAADYWIGTSTIDSKAELAGQDSRYQSFAAFAADKVYNYSKRRGPSGGYDFFESGYARPDLVLADLIKVLHPDLLPDYETVYFQKLK